MIDLIKQGVYLLHGTEIRKDATGMPSPDEARENTITYGIIDIRTKKLVSQNFITDGTEKSITIPYGIAIHPETGDIFVTDAKNYVSSGTLYCFDHNGRRKWSVRIGDIPAHITFLKR